MVKPRTVSVSVTRTSFQIECSSSPTLNHSTIRGTKSDGRE